MDFKEIRESRVEAFEELTPYNGFCLTKREKGKNVFLVVAWVSLGFHLAPSESARTIVIVSFLFSG